MKPPTLEQILSCLPPQMSPPDPNPTGYKSVHPDELFPHIAHNKLLKEVKNNITKLFLPPVDNSLTQSPSRDTVDR